MNETVTVTITRKQAGQLIMAASQKLGGLRVSDARSNDLRNGMESLSRACQPLDGERP